MFLCLRNGTGAEGRTDTFDVQTRFLCVCVLEATFPPLYSYIVTVNTMKDETKEKIKIYRNCVWSTSKI